MDTIIEEYINLAFISTNLNDLKQNFHKNRFYQTQEEKLLKKTKEMLGI
jgi:hypothetical protein